MNVQKDAIETLQVSRAQLLEALDTHSEALRKQKQESIQRISERVRRNRQSIQEMERILKALDKARFT